MSQNWNRLQADGTVTIPDVLKPYCGFDKLVPNKK